MPGGYKRGWEPLERQAFEDIKPFYRELHERGDADVEVWLSARYEVTVRASRTSPVKHLSINLRDRSPMRNWRHLQQAKDEVCGELWTGIEIFPPEDQLTDAANQYHLFCFPPGFQVGGFTRSQGFVGIGLGDHPMVSDDDEVERWNSEPHPGRQEPVGRGSDDGPHRPFSTGAGAAESGERPTARPKTFIPTVSAGSFLCTVLLHFRKTSDARKEQSCQ